MVEVCEYYSASRRITTRSISKRASLSVLSLAVNGSVKAYVRWTSHLSNSDNIKITSVIISNRYLNVSINENFTEVKLPDSVNGPGWRREHTVLLYLF